MKKKIVRISIQTIQNKHIITIVYWTNNQIDFYTVVIPGSRSIIETNSWSVCPPWSRCGGFVWPSLWGSWLKSSDNWKKTCGSYTSAQNNLLKKKEYDKSGKTNLVSWTATPSSRISIFPIIPGKWPTRQRSKSYINGYLLSPNTKVNSKLQFGTKKLSFLRPKQTQP